MNYLPEKRSRKWIWVCIGYALLVYSVLLISRVVLHAQLDMETYIAFGIISVSLALIACAGGWLGGRLYFLCSAIGSIIGSIYLLYISITDSSPGWSDLTSLVGFMLIAAVGIGAGLIVELIRFIIRRKKT